MNGRDRVLDRHPEPTIRSSAEREPGEPFIDSWGIGILELEHSTWFPVIHPFKDAETLGDLETYQGWPDMNDLTRVGEVADEVR
ncbi:MAG: hypothetical protein PVH92_04585 [Anaerolineales bacterium]|jgi:hypothetical protein